MARRSKTASDDRGKSKKIGALRGLAPFLTPYTLLLLASIAALMFTADASLILSIAVRRVVDGFMTGDTALLDQYFFAALAWKPHR